MASSSFLRFKSAVCPPLRHHHQKPLLLLLRRRNAPSAGSIVGELWKSGQRSFSSSSVNGGSSEQCWRTNYRRLLGIGDCPLLRLDKERPTPSEPGLVVISYSARFSINFHSNGLESGALKTFWAFAENSSRDLLGHSAGSMENVGDQIGTHLFALRAVGNLIQVLRETGIHGGPLLIASKDPGFEEVARCLDLDGGNGEEDEEKLESVLRESMPDNLEDLVAKNCRIDMGKHEEMMEFFTEYGKEKIFGGN